MPVIVQGSKVWGEVRPVHEAVRGHQEIPRRAWGVAQFEDLSANTKNPHTSQRGWRESAVPREMGVRAGELLEKFKGR